MKSRFVSPSRARCCRKSESAAACFHQLGYWSFALGQPLRFKARHEVDRRVSKWKPFFPNMSEKKLFPNDSRVVELKGHHGRGKFTSVSLLTVSTSAVTDSISRKRLAPAAADNNGIEEQRDNHDFRQSKICMKTNPIPAKATRKKRYSLVPGSSSLFKFLFISVQLSF